MNFHLVSLYLSNPMYISKPGDFKALGDINIQ